MLSKFKKIPLSHLLLFIPLLLIYALFLSHKIDLVTADLGRHLKNGQYVFHNLQSLSTNFYSYTWPDFPAINHHWGSGVIFYLIYKFSGFTGLSFFSAFLSLITFSLFYYLAQQQSRPAFASLASLLIIPLLAERTEIRPEIFSYFFSALFYWLLLKLNQNKTRFHLWLSLPILEVFWVNLHIYFFLGPLLIGTFLLESIFFSGFRSPKTKTLLLTISLTALAALINPFGFTGALAPLTIFNNYGYRLIENQPLWFIQKLIHNPNFTIFKFIFAALVLSYLIIFLRKKQARFSNFLLSVFFSLIAWLAIRNFTIFGFFAIIFLSNNLHSLFKKQAGHYQKQINQFAFLSSLIILTLLSSKNLKQLFPYWRQPGFGLETNNSQAAEFIQKNKIKGPIFNNYDIGGYLIFYLFPDHPVFVDNRPEAYPNDFFQNIYIPMQENEEKWQTQNQNYRFNAIVFSHGDATPWGQNFLINRLKDPLWTPVFADQYVIIFLNKNSLNQKIIQEYELPQDMFSVKQTK